MRRVLTLLAHPALERSRLNRRLVEVAEAAPGACVHDLYEEYPDLAVDVDREQERAAAADVLLWVHPVYWYSAPALVKQWIDLVLEHGWAYGSGGSALAGKYWLHAVTAGGPRAAYSASGINGATLREMFRPFEATARLCGMRYLAPFAFHGTHRAGEDEIAAHAAEFGRLLSVLTDDRVDLPVDEEAPYLRVPETRARSERAE